MIFLYFFSFCAFSQIGGEKVYQFLNISTSARQVALGGETLTLVDNVNQPTWNPATITSSIDKKLSVNYTNYLAGVNVGSAAFAYTINRRVGTLQTNIKYLNYGTLIGADEQGNETGNFSASDIALSVGYAYPILPNRVYIGTNLKVINSVIDTFSSTGIAFDFGMLYYRKGLPYKISLVVRNVGTQITSYNGTSESLPLQIAIGGSYKLEHVPLCWYFTINNLQKWNLSVPNPSNSTTDFNGNVTPEKITFINNLARHFVLGVELFPEKAINLRLGYNFKRGNELKLQNVRTFGGISFGFGLKMNKLKLQYAYSKYHSATNVSTFSLQIDMGEKSYKRGKDNVKKF
ncbi:type IX secretion system protein PorQ [Tenacibaculum sp. UWU-22]|uniref:type IX secretion system protein PorQ n=1 Tax=Tenacibaculum sp. UWU-22 TaxID=3234187 RepID=UPI0034DB1840